LALAHFLFCLIRGTLRQLSLFYGALRAVANSMIRPTPPYRFG
jgi:hypothetical protein